MIKMAAFAAACYCLVAVATAPLCAANSVQSGHHLCVCAFIGIVLFRPRIPSYVRRLSNLCIGYVARLVSLYISSSLT